MATPEKGRRSIGKYEREWGRVREIAERVIDSGEQDLSRVLRLVEAEWRGMTAEPADGLAFGVPIVLPDAALFGGRRDLILSVLRNACRPETGLVAELGSGSGINLLNLHLWGGPRAPYHALEPTEQGRSCVTLLAGLDRDLRLTAEPFDFESPRYDLPRVGHALVFTSHSIEQVTDLPREAITGLFDLGDTVTGVHFEPIGWHLREASADDPARGWGEKKRYNRNLWSLLDGLASAGEIRIDTVVPDIIGDNRRNASTLVVWHR
ncbi:MAG: hypothetical protein ACM3QU_03360 [Verrucomicrobiota bacterium]